MGLATALPNVVVRGIIFSGGINDVSQIFILFVAHAARDEHGEQ
jgi:hypothetical protein